MPRLRPSQKLQASRRRPSHGCSHRQRVLMLPPFRHVTQDDFRELLVHLIDIDHIEQMPEGGLTIGLTGEKVVRNFRICALFPDNEEFTVSDGSTQIGSIVMPPPPGERFALAGFTWEALEIDLDRRMVYAKRVGGRARAAWAGGGGEIHTRVLERMRQALLENTVYPYLRPGARKRLSEARALARRAGLDSARIIPLGGQTMCIIPWLGTVAYRTLHRILRHRLPDRIGVRLVAGLPPCHLTVSVQRGGTVDLHRELAAATNSLSEAVQLLAPGEVPCLGKYDEFAPQTCSAQRSLRST